MIRIIKPSHLKLLPSSILIVLLVTVIGVNLSYLAFAASGSLTLSPSSGSYTLGDDVTVTMDENSGTDAAIGVDAFINYSSNLQFISASSVSPFSVAPPDNATGSTVAITRGAYSGVTGDQVVSVITFKTIGTGSATLAFNAAQSSISSSATPATNLLVNSPGAAFTINSAVVATPPTTGTPPVTTQPVTHATTAAPTSNVKGTSISVTPKSSPSTSTSSVTVPNNGAVEVTKPVSVQPTTIQTQGVNKIQYYLSGKLVDTATAAPYTYNIDTTKLKNGSYNLVSKTYYSNGMIKETTHKLIVKNVAQHSRILNWGIITLAVIAILIIFIIMFRSRSGGIFRHAHSAPTLASMPGSAGVIKIPGLAPVINEHPHNEDLTQTVFTATNSANKEEPKPSQVIHPQQPSAITKDRTSSQPGPGTTISPDENQ